MENLRKTDRCAVALGAMTLLAGCAVTPLEQPTLAAPPPPMFGITQAGGGTSTRYVFCHWHDCPTPSVKTRLVVLAPVPTVTAVRSPGANSAGSVHIAFPFNSSRISDNDRRALQRALTAHAGAGIEITARSDFVGPPAGQQKVIAARARAMRGIVANQAQGAHITEHRAVADPKPVDKARQAQQRRGTVRFTPSTDVPSKGIAK